MKWNESHLPIVMEDEGLFRAIVPGTMKELMAYLCLDRQLPEEHVEKYVHNKNNPDCITYECPDLEPILGPTYGCLVYQEQVMRILQVLGGFSPEQSDLCRRALSKKQRSVIDRMRKQFVEGATSTVPGYFTKRIDEDMTN
jgi:DNA polymerase III alpha subunit